MRTVNKPSPLGEGGFSISLQEIEKTDVGEMCGLAEDFYERDVLSYPTSVKNQRFLTASLYYGVIATGNH